MSSSTLISESGLGKAYRIYERPVDQFVDLLVPGCRRGTDFWALQDVDLTVERGEAVGVIGRNGSGKSTLLQLAFGILRPNAGTIAVNGRVAGLLELGAGFNPDFTGRENVQLAAAVLGLKASEIAARLDAIEEFAGIGSFIDRPVREYSSGMYARLAFAVCAHVDADILLIDEIFAVGDAAFQKKCMRYLRGFLTGGGTVLFVSHSEAAVLALCERAIWLDRGQLQADGPSGEVCRKYAAGPQDSGNSQRAGTRTAARETTTTPLGDPWIIPVAPASVNDARWRNENPIEVGDFDADAPWHGEGGAMIEHAGLFSFDGAQLSMSHGGEEVELRISCRAMRSLTRPIVGYIFRNERGENLAGDNTYLHYRATPFALMAGDTFTARFRFQLPYLPVGRYYFALSIIEGTQAAHTHLHWVEDAFTLQVQQSPIRRGAVGVPMLEVALT